MFETIGSFWGMPEIVKTYLKNKSIADLPKIYEGIYATYKNIVEKYSVNDNERKEFLDTGLVNYNLKIQGNSQRSAI